MLRRTLTSHLDRWFNHRLERRMAAATSRRAHHANRLLVGVLSFFVIVMLFEVVITPGSMIRRHLHSAVVAPSEIDTPTALSLHQRKLERLSGDLETEWADLQRNSIHLIGVNVA